MSKTYRFYTDSGHGWVAVPIRELFNLNIVNEITRCSYRKGNTVYLEEDCDAGLFFRAYEKRYGHKPLTKEYDHGNWSRIRSYDRYTRPIDAFVFNHIRHAYIFDNVKDLMIAGYVNASKSDMVAVTTGSNKIGLVRH